MSLNGSDSGAISRRKPLKEQQAFVVWREEQNWEERALENIAHRYNFEQHASDMVELREQLRNGNYRPQEVKGMSIPKPNGRRRQLGIPTAIDR